MLKPHRVANVPERSFKPGHKTVLLVWAKWFRYYTTLNYPNYIGYNLSLVFAFIISYLNCNNINLNAYY